MDKYEQLGRRIEELEKKLSSLQNSATIPLNIDKSFVGRGFLKSLDFLYSGRVQIGAAGFSIVPIPGATGQSVAFVTYHTFPAPGVPVAYIQFSVDHYEMYIDANALTVVDFVVFLNNKGDFVDLT